MKRCERSTQSEAMGPEQGLSPGDGETEQRANWGFWSPGYKMHQSRVDGIGKMGGGTVAKGLSD